MNLVGHKSIEERLVFLISKGPKRTTSLLEELNSTTPITKQGFYAALRKLKKEEVIVIYKSIVSLNAAWIKSLDEQVREMRNSYLTHTGAPGVLDLREGESVSYEFNSTTHLDAFWGHSQSLLIAQTLKTEPVYSYDPHYWFYLARPNTEKKLVQDIASSGRQFLMTVGGSSPLDKILRSDFPGDIRQYHMERLFDKENYYVVVIGTYITEVTLDLDIARQVSDIYEQFNGNVEEAARKLESLLMQRARHKIRIKRNARKAKELKARLGKNFFLMSKEQTSLR